MADGTNTPDTTPYPCPECGFSIDYHDGHLADHEDHDCGGPCYCNQRPSTITQHHLDAARAEWVAALDPRWTEPREADPDSDPLGEDDCA